MILGNMNEKLVILEKTEKLYGKDQLILASKIMSNLRESLDQWVRIASLPNHFSPK